jgi:nucleoside-diphosphate-sugar epimerase
LKTLIIIGGTGFFGKSFLDYSFEFGLKKWGINKLILISRRKKKIFLQRSLFNKKLIINKIFKDVSKIKKLPETDYIIYAINSTNNSNNIKGLKNFNKLLFQLIKKPQILFTSSGAVYGLVNKKKYLSEKEKISIKNINLLSGYKKKYAKNKIFTENYFKNLGKRGFKVSIARCFTFIGKQILSKNNYAISNFINDALTKNKVFVNSDKITYRSYMHSNDLIIWLMKILKHSNKNCPIFNVGSDESITIQNLADIIGKLFKKPVIFLKKNSKKIDSYLPSITKAKKTLKLKVNYNLKMAINSSILSIKP